MNTIRILVYAGRVRFLNNEVLTPTATLLQEGADQHLLSSNKPLMSQQADHRAGNVAQGPGCWLAHRPPLHQFQSPVLQECRTQHAQLSIVFQRVRHPDFQYNLRHECVAILKNNPASQTKHLASKLLFCCKTVRRQDGTAL